jgi:hypothetical protein
LRICLGERDFDHPGMTPVPFETTWKGKVSDLPLQNPGSVGKIHGRMRHGASCGFAGFLGLSVSFRAVAGTAILHEGHLSVFDVFSGVLRLKALSRKEKGGEDRERCEQDRKKKFFMVMRRFPFMR